MLLLWTVRIIKYCVVFCVVIFVPSLVKLSHKCDSQVETGAMHSQALALLPFKEGKWFQYYVTSTALTAVTLLAFGT